MESIFVEWESTTVFSDIAGASTRRSVAPGMPGAEVFYTGSRVVGRDTVAATVVCGVVTRRTAPSGKRKKDPGGPGSFSRSWTSASTLHWLICFLKIRAGLAGGRDIFGTSLLKDLLGSLRPFGVVAMDRK